MNQYLKVTQRFLAVSVIAVLMAGCGGSSQNDGTAAPDSVGSSLPVKVIVSIVPQAWIVDQIGGALVQVEVLAPPHHSPETYQITPRQMDALGKAALYFRIGMPFEGALVDRLHSTFPKLVIADTRNNVPMLTLSAHHHDDADEHEHEHEHGNEDPHIWLDPLRVKIQAHTVFQALLSKLPEQEAALRQNLQVLENTLDSLHADLSGLLDPYRGRTFFVYHPAFGYFADRYGLLQQAVEFEGKSPGAQRLYALIDDIRQSGATAIFTQPQFNVAELTAVARSAGVEMVTLDNLLYDYPESMRAIGRAIAGGLHRSDSYPG
ncbi:MAG TPA: zinc ABC transporter substrate-binding protein [Candidatus Hydrogenedentes bacterium]|jgi:zinc transport system substrate-binding protein|nr:zinc ABC transporter substrate-binding protein [Candidatus Hydrogenedentota bacterium]